jgi:hypothetical protein
VEVVANSLMNMPVPRANCTCWVKKGLGLLWGRCHKPAKMHMHGGGPLGSADSYPLCPCFALHSVYVRLQLDLTLICR